MENDDRNEFEKRYNIHFPKDLTVSEYQGNSCRYTFSERREMKSQMDFVLHVITGAYFAGNTIRGETIEPDPMLKRAPAKDSFLRMRQECNRRYRQDVTRCFDAYPGACCFYYQYGRAQYKAWRAAVLCRNGKSNLQLPPRRREPLMRPSLRRDDCGDATIAMQEWHGDRQ